MQNKFSRIKVTQSNRKLALGSICLMGVSLFLILGARIVVSQLALMAVLSAPELLVYAPAFCILGYVLMGVGVAGFLYLGLRSRFTVDTQRVKAQSRKLKFSVVALTCLLVVTSMFSTTSIVSANTVATTGYYLATPLPIADWYLGNYSNGNIFAINGSNWANLMTYPTPAPWAADTGDYTKVWQDVLAATSSGTIYAKGVAFPLSLQATIPNNTQVICNYQGVTYTYINANSTLGSPYTVSVGQGINSSYYLAADSGNRIAWSSLNQNTLAANTFAALTNGGSVTINQGAYNNMVAVVPNDVTLTINKGATGVIAYPIQSVTITNCTIIDGNTGITKVWGADGQYSYTPCTYSSGTSQWTKVANASAYEYDAPIIQDPATHQFIMFSRQGNTHQDDNGVVVMRTSSSAAGNFSNPTTILTDASYNLYVNDAIVTDDGSWVVFVQRMNIADSHRSFDVGYIISTDRGATWSSYNVIYTAPATFSVSIYQAQHIPTKGWMLSMYILKGSVNGTIFTMNSLDECRTWSYNSQIFTSGSTFPTECSIAYLGNGKILGLIRQEIENIPVYQVQSTDYGTTWTTPAVTNLIGENSTARGVQVEPMIMVSGDTVVATWVNRGAAGAGRHQLLFSNSFIGTIWNSPLSWNNGSYELQSTNPGMTKFLKLPDGRFLVSTSLDMGSYCSNIYTKLYDPFNKQTGGSTKVFDFMATAPITTMTITNLDFTRDQTYIIEIQGQAANTGTTGYVLMYVNNDFTNSSYSTEHQVPDNTAANTNRVAEPEIGYLLKNSAFYLHATVSVDADNVLHWHSVGWASGPRSFMGDGVYTTALSDISNVTLTISSPYGNQITDLTHMIITRNTP